MACEPFLTRIQLPEELLSPLSGGAVPQVYNDTAGLQKIDRAHLLPDAGFLLSWAGGNPREREPRAWGTLLCKWGQTLFLWGSIRVAKQPLDSSRKNTPRVPLTQILPGLSLCGKAKVAEP